MTDLLPTPMTAADIEPAWVLLEEAFADTAHPQDADVELATVQPERFLLVRDEGEVVATSGAFPLTVTVPGGAAVALAGISWVSVQPTHRRRGLLRAMMDRLLVDARDRGEPMAALYASEAAIYQRFGFGPASWRLSVTVPRSAALLHPVPAGRLRRVAPTAELLAPTYDVFAARTAGVIARGPALWDTRLHDPEHSRHGATALRCVLTDDGYVLHRVRNGDDHRGTVEVVELVATTWQAHTRLWSFLLGLDLTKQVRAVVPFDDPLLQVLAEPRAAQARVSDALWLRPVEVGSALSARAYAVEVDVVLDVRDATCPWNTGRWRLAGGPGGGTCTPTTDPADLALDVSDLGAALLGGTSLLRRASAGTVEERTAGALHATALAFGPLGREPWNPMTF